MPLHELFGGPRKGKRMKDHLSLCSLSCPCTIIMPLFGGPRKGKRRKDHLPLLTSAHYHAPASLLISFGYLEDL